jgi:hypothetical protein
MREDREAEFDFLAAPEGPATELAGKARRRRRVRRMAAVATSFVAVAAVAVAVPMVLAATGGDDVSVAAATSGAKPSCDRAADRTKASRASGTQPSAAPSSAAPSGATPPVRDLHKLVAEVQARQKNDKYAVVVRQALARVAPGVRIHEVWNLFAGDPACAETDEETVQVFVVAEFTYRGQKQRLEVHVTVQRGDPASRANQVAKTGDRMAAGMGAPHKLASRVQRQLRPLSGGTTAIVYPAGAEFWFMPVDLFSPRNVNISVSGSRYHDMSEYKGVPLPEEKLTPADIVLSVDQLLRLGQAVEQVVKQVK